MMPLSPSYIQQVMAESGVFTGHCELRQIEGGAVNLSYQLKNAGNTYFVKVFTSDVMTDIDRKAQFQQQAYLASLGFAPRPVFIDPRINFQVDTWVEGQSLKELAIPIDEKLRFLGCRMADVHSELDHDAMGLRALDLPAKWQDYAEIAQVSDSVADEISRLGHVWYTDIAQVQCVCHNDMSFQHLVYSASGIIFDWEYSAYSSPYFDLAACLQVNQESYVNARPLLEGYADKTGSDLSVVESRVEAMLPLAEFTNRLWFLAAERLKITRMG